MTSAEPESLGTAALVRRGPFARFFWAAVIGSTGDWVTVFAMLTLADRIGSQEGVLIALMSRILPGLVLGGVVGVISDRVDRRKLVVFADLGRGLFVPLLALVNTLPQLVGITLLLELLSLMGQPPRTAMVPRLVPAENLVGANSLMLGAAYGTVPLGSAVLLALAGLPNVSLGGLIPVANESLAPAFAVDALTFFVSGLLIATLPRIAAQAAVPTESTNNNVDLRSTWADFIAGAKFFATEPSVRRDDHRARARIRQDRARRARRRVLRDHHHARDRRRRRACARVGE
jgi:MFS family permease